jgi:glycosyltransferase involved in cell wall biosynthesis
MPPLVSIVIPTYNYARFVGHAIRSALGQTFADREVIVVDDGSTDDTRDVVGAFGDAVRSIHQPNGGLSAARNTGIRAARGRYVAFQDSDDIWLPDKLAHQVPVLEARPEVGLVYCDSIFFDDATGADMDRQSDRFEPRSGRVLEALITRGNFIASPTPLVRREVFEQAGLFDESLRSCEDWDMWIRAAARWEVAYVPVALTRYRVHGNSMSKNIPRMREAQLVVLRKTLAALGARDVDRAAAWRRLYVDTGLAFFTLGRYAEARADLWSALTADRRTWTDRHVLSRLLLALLGERGVRLARAGYRALRGAALTSREVRA